ncbi:MAG: hypothetical protein JXB48_03025, partial [Candidatus Latescibacteria bacterium]|nr:hypothetical protein [Candidatus Latescibacterota bacterium]
MMQRQWLPVTVLSIVCLFVSSCGEQRIQIKPGWTISKLKYGKTSGTTSVGVYFPKAGDNLPLTFGIPLGQSESCDDITLFDQNGNSLPVSCIPLANWWVHPARWTLISTVVVSKSADSQQTLTIKWGAGKLQKSGISLEHTITNAALTIKNGDYTLVLSMNGIERLITQGKSADLLPNNCSITLKNGNITQPGNLIISVLHDSPLYKKFRCSATLTDGLDIHREYELWAGSPYVRCSTRYINRTLKDIPLNSISPVNVHMRDAEQAYFGVVGQSSITGEICEIHQRAFECFGVADGVRYPFKDDMETGVWAMVPETVANPGFMLVFPYFRGMAAGNADMESVVSCQNGTMRLEHFMPLVNSADVRIRETMARTFTCWLVVNS